MNAAEVIERTIADQHLAESRRIAVRLFAQFEELLDSGYDPDTMQAELYAQFRKYRGAEDRVVRDALVEVIEALEERFAA